MWCWHEWSKWEQYVASFKVAIGDKTHDCIQNWQKRHCEKCGYEQRQEVNAYQANLTNLTIIGEESMSRQPYSGGISSCCGKGLIVVSDDTEGTSYYECEKCGEPCDDRNFND